MLALEFKREGALLQEVSGGVLGDITALCPMCPLSSENLGCTNFEI